ncbi:AraC family transcriptional regulator with amidase-like domain [Rhizobium sp. ERR 922]|nr:AraC family transcriptional regulator with amidase-like domain [Rhizobium sp. ERR 922]TWB95913.1 AraC family transcriptional regulator with amidase-like domain [Rhizobium sp. ERR 942]
MQNSPASKPDHRIVRVAIIAVDGSLLSAIAGITDLFWITNQALQAPPEGPLPRASVHIRPLFETVIVSADGANLPAAQGRSIAVDAAFADVRHCDVILVAGMALGTDGLPPSSDAIRHAANWLQAQHRHGVLIGGACAGTFVLGEAGLLDGKRCTTTWWLHNAFKRRFPKARPIWGTAIEEQDNVITTGGPLSWIDLALHVIKRTAGADVAKLAADVSVADNSPMPQMVYAPRGFVNAADPLLLRAEQIIRGAGPGLTAEALASELKLSARTLHRRLKELTGEAPKSFITRVRMETACVLLETPGSSIKQVAVQCGYTDETAFRRAFTQLSGMTPGDYRRWSQKRLAQPESPV